MVSRRHKAYQYTKPSEDSLANDTSAHSYKIEELSRTKAIFKRKKLTLEEMVFLKTKVDELAKKIYCGHVEPVFVEFYQEGMSIVEINNKNYIALRRVKKPNCGSARFIDVLDLKNKRKKEYDLVQFKIQIKGKKIEQEGPESTPLYSESGPYS